MAIWINNYSKNQVSSKVNLYLYSNEPKIYPSYETAPIVGLNPNVFTNFETIEVDGEIKNITIDFSGINAGDKRFGDAGSVYCPAGTCQTLPWPRCNAQWLYATVGDQVSCQQNDACDEYDCLFENYLRAPDGGIKQPHRLIDPRIESNGKYWNNTNLWYNGSYLGNVLVENDGSSYENGGYEYLITIGHPISTYPCREDGLTIGFFDPNSNSLIYRNFICPCLAFGSSEPGLSNSSGWFGLNCNGPDSVFTNDNYRLWVMRPGQNPIPSSIKRYKLLSGKIREGFPTYGFHNNHIITKAIIKRNSQNKLVGFADRSIPESYGFGSAGGLGGYSSSGTSQNYFDYMMYNGQGDDGGACFTVTPDGETIFIGFHNNTHGSALPVNQAPPIFGENRCNGPDDLFYINQETKSIEFNTWCLPSIYHPEEVIPNYPDNDTLQISSPTVGISSILDERYRLNQRLEQLNKPKIVTYSFPEMTFSGDEINIPQIDDTTEKFPLKEYPYLSRESKNTFYQNVNLIAFEEQKMLQASELNELQEKFYRKQSLFIEFTRNWLKKQYLTTASKDILGFSIIDSLYNGAANRMSKIVPFNEQQIEIIQISTNNISIVAKPGWYMINSQFKQANRDPFFGNFTILPGNNYYNLDFIKIEENITIPLDFSNLTNNNYHVSVIGIDMLNLVSCVDYSDLKDNSGGSSENAPCGAKRNLSTVTFNQSLNINKDPAEYNITSLNYFEDKFAVPVFSYASPDLGAPHLLTYSKMVGNAIETYLSNGILIATITI